MPEEKGLRSGSQGKQGERSADERARGEQAREPASEGLLSPPSQGGRLNVPPPPTGLVFSSRQVQRARDLLTRLYAARRTAAFYPLGHPAVQDAVRSLMESLELYHGEGMDVPLAFYEGELLLGEQLLPEESVLFDQLIRDVTALGAGSIVFRQGLTYEELEKFVRMLSTDVSEVRAAGGMPALGEAAGLEHVSVGRVVAAEHPVQRESGRDAAKAAYADGVELMRELERVIRANQVIGIGQVRSVVRSLVENVLENRHAMLELTGLKSYDEYTFYHSVNVAILSLALGSSITQDVRFLSSLGVGALLHDVGKITIDLSVLNKPGSLTPDEWAKVRMHPVYGAEMVARMPGLDKAATVIVLEHHMREDLGGYPQRVPPRPMHLASRMVAVCDAYDAMTSKRSYSAARLQDEAVELLAKNAGSAFDPALVRSFVGMLGVFPPRSVVLLNTGEVAVVIRPSDHDPTRPIVRIIAGQDGQMIDPLEVDLSDEPSAQGRVARRCLDPAGLNVDVEEYV